MPNTPTARAELRKSLNRRERNRGRRSAMRTAIKNVLESIAERNLGQAESQLKVATAWIDKNVKWNQLHANTAAHKKSQLARAVQGLRAAGQPA
jgi:small subunit ribosomal protein S20